MLNNMVLNNQWITEEIKGKIKKYLETTENESTMIQNLSDAAKAIIRGSLQQYNFTSGNKKNLKQPKLTPKATKERRTNKTQSQQKERNHKHQSRNK